MNKKILTALILMLLTIPAYSQQTPTQNVVATTSLNVVKNPEKYLNQTVKMQATFDKFSTLGLDYSKAMRSSKEYIGILFKEMM